jgi:aryl-alcohol dehydrogenase-like predicted oxidoreductase
MRMSAFDAGAGVDDAESIGTLHPRLDPGIAPTDTAEVDGPDTNDELVGRAKSASAHGWHLRRVLCESRRSS